MRRKKGRWEEVVSEKEKETLLGSELGAADSKIHILLIPTLEYMVMCFFSFT